MVVELLNEKQFNQRTSNFLNIIYRLPINSFHFRRSISLLSIRQFPKYIKFDIISSFQLFWENLHFHFAKIHYNCAFLRIYLKVSRLGNIEKVLRYIAVNILMNIKYGNRKVWMSNLAYQSEYSLFIYYLNNFRLFDLQQLGWFHRKFSYLKKYLLNVKICKLVKLRDLFFSLVKPRENRCKTNLLCRLYWQHIENPDIMKTKRYFYVFNFQIYRIHLSIC